MKSKRSAEHRKALHYLREYGQWHRKYADYSGFPAENVVERVINNPGRSERREHMPLSPDMPRHLQAVERSLDALTRSQRNVIDIEYCCPLKEDGNAYTEKELSGLLGYESISSYRSVKSKARKNYLLQYSTIFCT